MKLKIAALAITSTLVLAGCETTNSIPYKASSANVISIQQTLQAENKKVKMGKVQIAQGVDESPMCRLMGPVKVAPGKTIPQYIEAAFQEELFLAQVYNPSASTEIQAVVEELKFSSVTPAFWEVSMTVKSNLSEGYKVSVKYPFGTSWSAPSACKNVADAFGPAVQELLKEVVNHPDFKKLV
ncbi:MAG: hypothetical protein ACK4GU_14520 [Alishewanella aestuarii]|uniref:Lipoprotein n=1 Tax=Alishewanella aestuarii B11 TaxID=1197174 RepID=J1QM30_9ALTE|nr:MULTISPECIES: hypothetical protein [Alishewanella]EJI86661.1 hypothetical protein AEST_02070 [Alishewanella aestuarii B11]MCT8127500.1 hypothetical protein [Alishewanella sp. BS5-314]